MEYRLLVNEVEQTLTLTSLPSGGKTVCVADRTQELQLVSIRPGEFLLTLDGQLLPFYLVQEGRQGHLFLAGETFVVEDLAEARVKRKEKPEELARQVTPPMPATVIRVLCTLGATVKRREPLIVLSAMKMENTLLAPYDGVVTKINTVQGAQVMPGDILVEIEPTEEKNGT